METETPIVAFELKDAAATTKMLQAGKVVGTVIGNENRIRLAVSVFNTHEDIDRSRRGARREDDIDQCSWRADDSDAEGAARHRFRHYARAAVSSRCVLPSNEPLRSELSVSNLPVGIRIRLAARSAPPAAAPLLCASVSLRLHLDRDFCHVALMTRTMRGSSSVVASVSSRNSPDV